MTTTRKLRVAVIGGTGLAGHYTVEALRRAGCDVVVVARSRGTDVVTGRGLDEAMSGVNVVVDVSNARATDADGTLQFFSGATKNLLSAEQRAHVEHHLLLSIVNVDRMEGNAHYAGKRAQEELVASSTVPWTIQRATQFHEFAGMVVDWTRKADVAYVPPLLLQPVAASDVGFVLAELAVGPARGRAPDLAGPQPEDLVDMARRTLSARGESLRLVPSWRTGLFGVEAAGEMFLPGPGARLGLTTFDTWLKTMQR
jgi:uncharacterized protein YbjT (DUF2867 family)